MLGYFALKPPVSSPIVIYLIDITISLCWMAYLMRFIVAITEYTNDKQKASLGHLDLQFFYAECMEVLRYQRSDSEYYMRSRGYVPSIVTTRFQRWLREKTGDMLRDIAKQARKENPGYWKI